MNTFSLTGTAGTTTTVTAPSGTLRATTPLATPHGTLSVTWFPDDVANIPAPGTQCTAHGFLSQCTAHPAAGRRYRFTSLTATALTTEPMPARPRNTFSVSGTLRDNTDASRPFILCHDSPKGRDNAYLTITPDASLRKATQRLSKGTRITVSGHLLQEPGRRQPTLRATKITIM